MAPSTGGKARGDRAPFGRPGETSAPDTHRECRRKNVERWNDGFFKGLSTGLMVAFLAVLLTIAVIR